MKHNHSPRTRTTWNLCFGHSATVLTAALLCYSSAYGQAPKPGTTQNQPLPERDLSAIDTLLREVNAAGSSNSDPNLSASQAQGTPSTGPSPAGTTGTESAGLALLRDAASPSSAMALNTSGAPSPLADGQAPSSTPVILNEGNTTPVGSTQIPGGTSQLNPSSENTQGTQGIQHSLIAGSAPSPATGVPSEDAKAPKAESAGFVDEILSSSNNSPNIWKNLSAAGGFLLLLALGAVHYTRGRSNGKSKSSRSLKAMQLVATLPISPKRQVLLIRVRDTEFALASTEHGVSLISEVKESNARAIESHSNLALERSLPSLAAPAANPIALGRPMSTGSNETKSEILKKALETIENKRNRSKNNEESDVPQASQPPLPSRASTRTAPANRRNDVSNDMNKDLRNEATLAPTGTPRLKKFFANSYKQTNAPSRSNESATPTPEREAPLRSEGGSLNRNSTDPADPSHSQTENVAQLIRDKLKQMRAIN